MANVSVIIPCYNAEKTIKETIESVLAQTYQDFEIIVVDDGSTDHSSDVIQSFGSKVKYIYQENSGRSSVARNTGINAASGNFLAFVDADDLWLPEKLEKQLQLMEQEGTKWCYCDSIYFRDTDKKVLGTYNNLFYPAYSGKITSKLLLGNTVNSPTPIIHKDIIKKAGMFDVSLVSREDWEMWLRVSLIGEASYVPEPLAKHRVHAASKTFSMDPDFSFENHVRVVEKITAMKPEELMPLRNKALAHYAAKLSKSHFLNQNYVGAKKLISKAVEWQRGKLEYQFLNMFYRFPERFLDLTIQIRKWLRGER